MPLSQRRILIQENDTKLSIRKQCEILGINRSSFYYEPALASGLNLELMQKMDEHYLENSFKGARRMYVYLTEDLGYKVSLNRIERLYYDVMGLRAIFPGPHTSKRNKDHKVYPYLLRNLDVTSPNHVWATDISYIPMPKGFMYLTAIIDLYSRYVVNWSLSNTMDAKWCAECFLDAIGTHGKPQIINTDQGSQYTSEEFTSVVIGSEVKLSMDGKGRATDNAFIEGLWKMVKYEDLYLKCYDTVPKLYRGLDDYFENYNYSRRHSSLDNRYPFEFFYS
jgi:putative transposase